MMNRLIRTAQKADRRLKTLDKTQIFKLSQDLEMSFEEICYYQELKALAQAKGLISLEEAQTFYKALLDWEGTPLSLKVSITQGLGELAQLRLKEIAQGS